MNQPTLNQPTSKAHWYILGAGAIGCLWACYWRKAGFPVTLITRTSRDNHNLKLVNNENIETFSVEQITVDNADNASIEHLLVCTKAQDTVDAVTAICQQLASHATVVVLQNGMAATELAQLLPTQKLITAITSDGAYRTDNNTVVHAGRGETFVGNAQALLQQLPTQFLNIQNCSDIARRQWQKLAINCAINGLTAIYHCRNGELLSQPEAQQRIKKICAETIITATAIGQHDAVSNIEEDVKKILEATAHNFSSMQQDIAAGRRTEIDYLNGYLVTLAEQQGLPCEENKNVLTEVKRLEPA